MTRSTQLRRTPLARGQSQLARKAMKRKAAKRWRPTSKGRAFWAARRAEVLERDGYKCRCPGCAECIVPAGCESCQCVRFFEIDHREPLRMGGSRYDARNPRNAVGNLVTLCRACHREKTEGRVAERKRRAA